MRKVIMIPFIIFAIIIGLFFGKNMIIKTSVTTGVKAMTGLKMNIRSMDVGVFKSLIGINGLQLHNPQGFEDKLMMDLPEIYVDYNLGDFMKGKTHLEETRLHLKEFTVVKNEAGVLNLNALKVVKTAEGETEEKAEKGNDKKQKAKMPDIQIDLLGLKIDKVTYKDYSKGTSPKVKEFNVKIDEQFENITDPQSFVRLIIISALKNTSIANLTNFDIKKLQQSIKVKQAELEEKLNEAGKKLDRGVQEASEKVGKELDKKAREVQGAVDKAGKNLEEKAADAVKKFLPFGKKEKK
ncbi:RTX toxins and related Ca2+-binding proteins [Candidatus Scalindua japonica]|uniref:RTX toxins and related Ca2+-binding proteins n=1 Tax=Candidatus Scalindua japonica TaxID=1284222 RepID=A0A286TZK9_9BACT|nr:hypothetical protein [Candidatus Scalindua japonica]GAX61333.1 RTX toxins and related Ca2+-binding proteins [Candidatus Scalindua japonica]